MARGAIQYGQALLTILRGILRLRHIQQFVVITLSVSFLLMLFRVIAFTTFLLTALTGLLSIAVLRFLDRKLRRWTGDPGTPEAFARVRNPERQVRYELRSFSLPDDSSEAGTCGICLKPIREGTEVAYLPCMHAFHTECVQRWIRVQNLCPMCKAPLE